ncbi:glycosyl hydrolase family 28-related protein [Kitasatospora sp. NPDC059599]|uniref:glycosyl hydrolase family 28-related protein n=1 Tax=Kitasatospora sp. NPDC059599 TaxID=3346880 RepID=UPI0036A17EDD
MDIEIMQAERKITAGQAVRTTGFHTVTPADEKGKLHTSPFFGVAQETVERDHDVKVQISGAFPTRIGSGLAGAVGVDISGRIVRASDENCRSAPNWIGDCDASGTVTIRPRRDTRLNVLDFGAAGDGVADDTVPLQSALDCATRFETDEPVREGKVVYLPPGDYRITKPLVVKHHCILEGAGGAGLGVTENTRLLADVKSGDFNLSVTGIGPVAGEVVYCAIALVGPFTSGPPAVDPYRDRADYAVLRQFTLKSEPDQGKSALDFYQAQQMDGVRILAHGPMVETVGVSGFRRNGITIYASFGRLFGPTANANLTQMRDCVLDNNGQHGLDIGSHGNDNTNTMLIMNVSASTNGRDGIHDHSSSGCTFVSCHTAGNRHQNFSCDHNTGIQCAVYVGCYAEGDAPSVFKGGNIAVVGGNIKITPDSTYWGYNTKGPSVLKVLNNYSSVRRYWIAKEGVDIDEGERQTPGDGYVYRAIHAGHTVGITPEHPEGVPAFQNPTGETEELEGLVWICEGEYRPEFSTSNKLGDATDSTIIQDYGSITLDNKGAEVGTSIFRTQVQTSPPAVKGRIETSLVSPEPFHTYYQTAYENGPVPGALTFREAWIGNYLYGERRITVVHDGTPGNTRAGSCNFYSPGDLLLNATGASARQGPIGWAVNAPCGRRSAALDWTSGKHYRIGETVKPTRVNGFVYRLISYTGGPQVHEVSGPEEPRSWNEPGPGQSVGGLTSDNHLQWQTIYDLDANPELIEPLPHGVTGQADSRATDIDQLRADFNALLARMRDANLLNGT